MDKNAWIWIIAIVVIVGGGLLWWQSAQMPVVVMPADTSTTVGTGAASQVPANTDTPSASMYDGVKYDGEHFSPSEVTIKKGGTVTFNGTSKMWVASASHPAHTGYDGTSRSEHCAPGYTSAAAFDECKSGSSYSFTFEKVGTWPYHDHMNSSAFGKITVVE